MSRTMAWLTLFLIGSDLFVMSPLLPTIARELNVGTSASGWAVTAFALAYLVGGPTFGALADRRGRYTILAVALVVFAVANFATSLAPSFALLLIARAVAGLAASGVTPSVYALVSAAAPRAQRARWLAVVTSGLLLALTAGAPAGSLLSAAVGWRNVFLLLSAASLAILAITHWSAARRSEPADRGSGPETGRPAGEPPPSTLTRVRAVAVTSLWALAVYGFYTYLGTVLQDTARLSTGLVAAALYCFGMGAVIGNLAGGWLADRYGGRAVSVVSLLALAAAELTFGAVLHAGAVAILAVLLVMALAAYPYFTAQQVRLVSRHPEASGSLLAWNNSAMYAGILVGSGAGGVTLATLGAATLAVAAAAFAALGALVAVRSITTPPRMSPHSPGSDDLVSELP